MCYGGLCSLDIDDMWDLFKSFASYQWQCESTSESFAYSFPPPYGLHAQSPCIDQLKDLCHHYSSYLHVACFFANLLTMMWIFFPYYDIFDKSYVRCDATIETMDERHKFFVGEIRKFGLLSKTEPNLPFFRLEASLEDD